MDGLENQLFVWLPSRDNGASDGKRSDALLAQCIHQFGRGLGTERRLLFCGGVKEQRSVLGHHAIKEINPGEDAHKVGQLAPSDEKKPPAGSPEGDERFGRCVIHDAIMRERAIIVGRKRADVHGTPRYSSPLA
jgi:hypothetical protein